MLQLCIYRRFCLGSGRTDHPPWGVPASGRALAPVRSGAVDIEPPRLEPGLADGDQADPLERADRAHGVERPASRRCIAPAVVCQRPLASSSSAACCVSESEILPRGMCDAPLDPVIIRWTNRLPRPVTDLPRSNASGSERVRPRAIAENLNFSPRCCVFLTHHAVLPRRPGGRLIFRHTYEETQIQLRDQMKS